jgi:3-oxoacyl-[acyl-carrier protein] reductase
VTILVFGASGALGSSIAEELLLEGKSVVKVSRTKSELSDVCLTAEDWIEKSLEQGAITGIVWAQGVNSSGTVPTIPLDDLRNAFEANVVFIVDTLNQLLQKNALEAGVRCVALSSIWQEYARPNKLAYIASKASLSGLIPALAIDLAEIGVSINGVLPGVIDTPMTRANLTDIQIRNVQNSTPNSLLASPKNVSRTVSWLLSGDSDGITGQWIIVDNGWSVYRNV